MRIKVMLISNQDSNFSAIKSMIDDEDITVIGEASEDIVTLESIDNLSPDIIIITLGSGDNDVMDLIQRIIINRAQYHIILLADHLNVDILQSALTVGARNLIEFPKSAKEFSGYIKNVYHNAKVRMEPINENQDIPGIPKVITVFGAKGGLGKTTLATNLAVKLGQSRKKVALVDLDLQFGDANIFLDIDPVDTIFELAQEFSDPNIDLVRSYMNVHSSGIHVLCAPKSPEYSELISAEKVQNILSLLQTYYDYVIIDTPPSFNDITITALEASTTIIFVTGLDISMLKNSKQGLSILNSLQQLDKVKLIVNRAENISSITLNDVQKLIDCPIWAKIPSDYKIAVAALNRGIPFVTGVPKSKISQSVSLVATLLLEGHKDIASLSTKQLKELGILDKRKWPLLPRSIIERFGR